MPDTPDKTYRNTQNPPPKKGQFLDIKLFGKSTSAAVVDKETKAGKSLFQALIDFFSKARG